MANLETLQDVMLSATEPHAPSFYRDLYGMEKNDHPPSIRTWDEWHALPCVTRGDLEARPASERVFCPLSMVDVFSVSSGTRGKPPLFSPRGTRAGYEYRKEWYSMKGAFLSGIVPPHRVQFLFQQNALLPRVVALDPNNLKASLRLAAAAGVDGMYVPVFLAAQIAERLQGLGVGERIRFVELAGEQISKSLIRRLQEIFPNATLYASWGMTEVDASPMGIPCVPLAENEKVTYHLKEGIHMDLVHSETLAPLPLEAGSEGEILITSYPKSAAFPLVRYRTGDIARITETSCARHSLPVFTIVGRAESDFIKVPGGVLRVDEVERVLSVLDPSLERFEMHLHKTDTPTGVRYKAVLHIDAPQANADTFASAVALHLRIGPAFTYADGVREGRFEPLQCVQLADTVPAGKNRRMIAHPMI